MSTRVRTIASTCVLTVVSVFFLLGSASAAPPNSGYATYSAAVPNGADGAVSMTAGFGDILYSSTGSSGITIPGGSSAIQPLTTPFAGFIGLSSSGQQYINTRLNNGATATNTYRFSHPTPNNGKWAVSLGDIDAERLTISATKANGSAATASEIGFQAQYNYNDPSDSTPHLSITQSGTTVVVEDLACPSSCDSVGISVWLKPSVSLSSLSIVALGKSGFPVYQTWFATQFTAVNGLVDPFQGVPAVNPTPIPPLTLDLVDLNGPGASDDVIIASTTSDSSGNYNFPAVYPDALGTYEIDATGPYGEVVGTVSVPATDGASAVTISTLVAPAEYEVSGTVSNGQGDPTAFDVEVRDSGGTVITQSDVQADGTFSLPFVPPASTLQLVVVGPSGEQSAPTALNTTMGNVSGLQLVAPSRLANTGFPLFPLVLGAFVLIFGGMFLTTSSRRTRR